MNINYSTRLLQVLVVQLTQYSINMFNNFFATLIKIESTGNTCVEHMEVLVYSNHSDSGHRSAKDCPYRA